VIIKTNQSRGLKEAHYIYVAVDNKSLEVALNDSALNSKELVIEKLVPHHENFLIKSYVIGSQSCYFHIKNSIPKQTMVKGHKFTNTKVIATDLYQSHEKEKLSEEEEQFFKSALIEYGRQYGMTMFGVDIL